MTTGFGSSSSGPESLPSFSATIRPVHNSALKSHPTVSVSMAFLGNKKLEGKHPPQTIPLYATTIFIQNITIWDCLHCHSPIPLSISGTSNSQLNSRSLIIITVPSHPRIFFLRMGRPLNHPLEEAFNGKFVNQTMFYRIQWQCLAGGVLFFLMDGMKNCVTFSIICCGSDFDGTEGISIGSRRIDS